MGGDGAPARLVAVAALAGLLALGLARGAAHHASDKPASGLVRASGGGRLVGQKAAFAVQPSIGRVTARALDGQATTAIDLTIVVDGTSRPLALGRLEPLPDDSGLATTVGIDFEDGQTTAEISFILDAANDVLRVGLKIADPATLGDHTVALAADLLSEGKVVFLSGTGELADTGDATGRVLVIDDEPHPFGIVSSRGALAVTARAVERDDDPAHQVAATRAPLHLTVASPSLEKATPVAAEGGLRSDLRLALGASSIALWHVLQSFGEAKTLRVKGIVTGTKERARVYGLDAEGLPQVRATASADGRFEVEVPPTVIQWYAALDPTRTSAPIMFQPGTAYELRLDVSPGGELHVRVVDADTNQPLTARLIVHGIEGTLDPSFGPDYRASGAGPLIDAIRGEVTTPLPAGRYRVAATKGLEWSIDAKTIEITGGHGVHVELAPRHVVSTPHVIGCDLHVHARPSFDTPVSTEDRVLSLVAAGVDFAVPTEHNLVGEYGPALAAQDLSGELASVNGVEITTFNPRLGHFGLFPYPTGKGVPPYRHTSVGAIFRVARRGDPTRMLQVNHPRLPKGIGYFELAGFKPESGKTPGSMRTDFDSIEVYNGYDISVPSRVEAVMHDYYALLNLGHHYVATGSSDSHRIQYQWAGYPRTMVSVGSVQGAASSPPSAIDTTLLVAQLKLGHAVVTSGPIIEVEAGPHHEAHPGDELASSEDTVTAHVRVRAAPWVDVSSLDLVVGGKTVRTFEVASRPSKLGPEAGTREEAAARTIR
ncbi:MAG: hypothetical protein JWM74_2485, partial [Myxococcaceae bacterium]|nr:hypothetical protein [Myxococcaceae bacterium]